MLVPVNLKLRWFAIYAGFGLLLSLIITAVLTQVATRQIEEQVGTSLAHVAEQMAHQLEEGMFERLRDLQTAAKLIEVPETGAQQERLEQLIQALYSSYENYAWLGITSADGEVLISSNNVLEGADVSARPWFQGAMQNPYFIGDVHGALLLESILNPDGAEPLRFVDVAVPLKRPDGSIWGVLGSHLNWAWVQELERVAKRGLLDLPAAEIIIVSSEGQVLLGPKVNDDGRLQLRLSEAVARQGHGLQQWPDGAEYVVGLAVTRERQVYKGPEWQVWVREPATEAFKPVRELRWQAVWIGLAVALCFAGIGWLSAGRIARPYADISSKLEHEVASRTEELRRTNEKLERLATTDSLTGLLNRRALIKQAKQLRKRADRHGQDIAVVMIDLDNFKKVNDSYGHSVGDKVLKKLAKLAGKLVREVDIVARSGGEEFTLVLDGSDEKNAKAVTQRLAKQLREAEFSADGETFTVTLSAGVASWSSDQEFEIVLDKADELLYEAKEKGRDCVVAAFESESNTKEAD
ncbi:GGDEF domain-containing protein [Pseudidiomarina sp. 1APP75-32.1]|uniref:diguanylate cyclase n=1 Tax=Pseudidiomarina terrestris TaxID=2820060 RepID=A0AAW7QY90_9GAMM|nr:MULTISPECIES: sensor domain-containing diguanylate cyclase [unclassified Pseudidiomarina]MDN7124828.1 GGDEF domain-containing protein [Pseudidiomarina sp. 1APP75-32.1]MDN7129698.1 GGDEF domain-containing protein [Pseudidiomarina sp. 1APR75-15]